MDIKKAQELTKGKIGLRVKQESDGIFIYSNFLTLITDLYRLIKLKLNNRTSQK